MFKRFFGLCVLLSSTVCAEEPRLFIGVNLGTSLSSVIPSKQSGVTPLTKLLGGVSTSNGSYNKEAYLETSTIIKHNLLIIPTLGMSFPVTPQMNFEGAVSFDITQKDFLVSNETKSDKVLSEITRDIGLSGSVLMRLSRQYAIGPVLEGHIITSKTPLYPGASKKEYHNADIGFQTVYSFHRYFSIGFIFTSAFDQDFKVKDPDQTTTGKNDLTLDLKQVRAAISIRLTPI